MFIVFFEFMVYFRSGMEFRFIYLVARFSGIEAFVVIEGWVYIFIIVEVGE